MQILLVGSAGLVVHRACNFGRWRQFRFCFPGDRGQSDVLLAEGYIPPQPACPGRGGAAAQRRRADPRHQNVESMRRKPRRLLMQLGGWTGPQGSLRDRGRVSAAVFYFRALQIT